MSSQTVLVKYMEIVSREDALVAFAGIVLRCIVRRSPQTNNDIYL
jgi:hypothetical protein